MLSNTFFAFSIIAFSCFRWLDYAESKLPRQEVNALKEIASTMGATYWKFDGDSCQIKMVGLTPEPPDRSPSSIDCDCSSGNDTFCHVVRITFKGHNLPGMLPPQLVKLPYLKEVDFAFNYLNGTIPKEWASVKLTSISLLVNRLSGEIPKELGNITTLRYLNLEANQFSGLLPSELGSLFNLQSLILSSNKLSGNLPVTFAQLQNLTDLRINDNCFNGKIPSFIQNWEQLQRLILRNCNITGEIPSYFWTMKSLDMLDLSFNNLVGEIPAVKHVGLMRFVFLTGNMLRGNVPNSILKDGTSVDLSYNNFTWQGPEKSACGDYLSACKVFAISIPRKCVGMCAFIVLLSKKEVV